MGIEWLIMAPSMMGSSPSHEYEPILSFQGNLLLQVLHNK